jgi:hypothetical protein
VVSSAGAHDHGGATGGTRSPGEVPAGGHLGVDAYPRRDGMPFGNDQYVVQDAQRPAAGRPHGHGIAGAAAHTHTATLPKVFATS